MATAPMAPLIESYFHVRADICTGNFVRPTQLNKGVQLSTYPFWWDLVPVST